MNDVNDTQNAPVSEENNAPEATEEAPATEAPAAEGAEGGEEAPAEETPAA